MSKTAMIRVRTEPELKEKAETILYELGLNQTDAINLFYRQVVLQHGLPFSIKIPNAATRAAIEEVRGGEGQEYASVNELFAELDI